MPSGDTHTQTEITPAVGPSSLTTPVNKVTLLQYPAFHRCFCPLSLHQGSPVAFLPPGSPLQSHTAIAVGLRTGFCGSLTTFASWMLQVSCLLKELGSCLWTMGGLGKREALQELRGRHKLMPLCEPTGQ